MKETKIKIGTSSIRQLQIESEINSAIGHINGPLREAIENIGFTASEELLKDCLDGGRQITQEYYDRLNKELSILTIPSSKVLFEQSAHEGLKRFHTIRQQVVDKCGIGIRKYISFEDEIAVFTNQSKEQLSEDMGIYLTDPEEIELYNLHQEACESLNNLFQGQISIEWYRLFDIDKNRQFKPESLTNYSFLSSNIKRVKENGNK